MTRKNKALRNNMRNNFNEMQHKFLMIEKKGLWKEDFVELPQSKNDRKNLQVIELIKSVLSPKEAKLVLDEAKRDWERTKIFENNLFNAEVIALESHTEEDFNKFTEMLKSGDKKIYEVFPRERFWNVGGKYEYLLTYKRKDLKPINEWGMHQFIKENIGKVAFEGVNSDVWEGDMLFPNASRLMDTAHQYWMCMYTDWKGVGIFIPRNTSAEGGVPQMYDDGMVRLTTSQNNSNFYQDNLKSKPI
tara:strand:+ start:476 stop:1213 length:738 start_codon:yes stop_codon:yes gene_type:complete